MERVKRHKVWMVGLLLAVFMIPFAVKAVHIHEHSGHSCHDESHARHDCHDCPVCQFTLSSFTEAAIADYDFKAVSYPVKPVISSGERPYQEVPVFYGLRAPPVV